MAHGPDEDGQPATKRNVQQQLGHGREEAKAHSLHQLIRAVSVARGGEAATLLGVESIDK